MLLLRAMINDSIDIFQVFYGIIWMTWHKKMLIYMTIVCSSQNELFKK